MLKKLLYLYNDGHNPFPHLKGKGLHLIDGEYEYDGNPNDEQVYDQGFIIGNYAPNNDGGFLVMSDDNGVFEVDRREKDIAPPDYYKNQTSVYDDYDDDAEIFGYNDDDDDDDELQSINDEIKIINELNNKITNGKNIKELQEKINIVDNQLKIKTEQKNDLSRDMNKLVLIEIKNYQKKPKNHTELQIGRHALFRNISEKVLHSFHELEGTYSLNSEIVKREFEKYSKLMKVNIEDLMETMGGYFLRESKAPNYDNDTKRILNDLGGIILISKSKNNTKYDQLKNNIRKIHHDMTDEIISNRKLIENIVTYTNNEQKLDHYKKQYAERKKILDQKKRLATIKQLQGIDPEQALKDSLELNAELKEKEALATDKKLSQSAQKKANAKAKKEASEKQSKKQAEAMVSNALASLETKGTYGKNLEDFLSSQNGQPILQNFTGDTSKIIDIEKNGVIPIDEVQFTTKKKGPLNKACTLDLYNDNYVFEIKNYLDKSITDAEIPMQPSKFRGTKYFIPTYLENGELYSFKLNYTDPKGKVYDKEILPYNDKGREVIFIIRLKEGLYQYKPFLDKKNNKLIPNGEMTPDGRPLYYFEKTKLKPCLDHYDEPAFNLKGHLTPI